MQRVTISMDDELGEAFDGLIEGQGYAFLPGAKGTGNSTITWVRRMEIRTLDGATQTSSEAAEALQNQPG